MPEDAPRPIRKVLIANRGEIVCRVAATLHELGIRAIAVYSEADRGALHTRVCDDAVAIGPAEPRGSYLNVDAILAAARDTGADAVHPGYGFLAENAAFAAAVEAAGLTFIGPTPAQIRAMGDKREARRLAAKAGVPIVPGAEGDDPDRLAAAAGRLGYPVLVKAALGGGGKGMQVVADEAGLREAVDSARRLARSAFGDAAVYLEKRLERARHVEVQVLGDGQGNAVHMFERECSLQRRHQKVIEESPGPSVSVDQRVALTTAAVRLAEAVGYRGVGTVEMLVAEGGAHYFLEMNTRLQVEHPVTELVTGVDLVRAQLAVAATGALPFAQAALRHHGHAIEARVYAEDAARGFLPQAGTARRVRWPHGPFVRVDRGIEAGDAVGVHYDPLLAKLVVYGASRDAALARLAAALDATRVHGVITNLPFLRALARAPEMARAAFDTEWIERAFLPEFGKLVAAPAPELALAAAARAEALAGDAADAAGGAAAARAPDPFAA
ncbi:MAG TPA: biotin carboxylase N-terminal domain-containing protein, partial [Candidatus Eisenbacteria bacterium]|nr:biotin carboxylase N-terminal domain-containing protein [Candidatus Eisenbacteria bacterium]